jgi:hypothetical protein
MPRRPIRELEAPPIEKCVLPDEDGVGPIAGECREGCIDFPAGPRIDDLNLKSCGRAGIFLLAVLAGLTSTAIREAPGSISRTSSRRLPSCSISVSVSIRSSVLNP